MSIDTRADRHHFMVPVDLGALAPMVRVELYADALGDEAAFHQELTRLDGQSDAGGMSLFVASVPALRPAEDYTARILPMHSGVHVPLEAAQILWQR